MKLSQVLESHIYIEIEKSCSKCEFNFKEEEILSGLSRNMNEYTIPCPSCKAMHVPKFVIFSEFNGVYGLRGRKGISFTFLSPITLYKEFTNVIKSKGAQIVLQDRFLLDHKTLFWNMLLYFKMMRLPFWVLD